MHKGGGGGVRSQYWRLQCAPISRHTQKTFPLISENKYTFRDGGESTEYTECQALYSVVRIGSSQPLTCKRVLYPLLSPGGGGGGETCSLGKEGLGDTCIQGELYVIPLRVKASKRYNQKKKVILCCLWLCR